jgi:CheY-like chemotaxis protein
LGDWDMARIMHVDSEDENRRLVSSLLRREGHEVISACDGHDCLEKLEKGNVDLVLLDIIMPDMNGWGLYDRIWETNKGTKVAFMSTLKISEEMRKGLLEKGASDYIVKPFDNAYFVERVNQLVKKGR